MQSWFKVDRSAFTNEVIMRDSEHFIIWCYLLNCSAYQPHQVLFNGKPIILKKGQLITGRKRISAGTGVNESKVQRVLSAFENAQLIEQQTCSKSRLITVLQTSFDYEDEQQNEQQSNNKRTTSEQQANTYKKEKKDKKERRENYTHARMRENASEPSYDLDEFLKKSVHLKYVPKNKESS